MTSGQVFLWRRSEDGWLGRDGCDSFRVQVLAQGLDVESSTDETEFRRYFNLQLTFAEVASRLEAGHPSMRGALERQAGLRLCRPRHAEETLFCFICTANNHLARINAMIRRLEAMGNGQFPRAAAIAAVPEATFRELGFGYRARWLASAARFLGAQDSDWLPRLADGPYEHAFEALRALPGIGPKLADCICLYGLHFGEAVPVDTHLWQVACRQFFPEYAGSSLTERRYREIGDAFRARFGGLAGWAQLLLYFDNLERAAKRARL